MRIRRRLRQGLKCMLTLVRKNNWIRKNIVFVKLTILCVNKYFKYFCIEREDSDYGQKILKIILYQRLAEIKEYVVEMIKIFCIPACLSGGFRCDVCPRFGHWDHSRNLDPKKNNWQLYLNLIRFNHQPVPGNCMMSLYSWVYRLQSWPGPAPPPWGPARPRPRWRPSTRWCWRTSLGPRELFCHPGKCQIYW